MYSHEGTKPQSETDDKYSSLFFKPENYAFLCVLVALCEIKFQDFNMITDSILPVLPSARNE